MALRRRNADPPGPPFDGAKIAALDRSVRRLIDEWSARHQLYGGHKFWIPSEFFHECPSNAALLVVTSDGEALTAFDGLRGGAVARDLQQSLESVGVYIELDSPGVGEVHLDSEDLQAEVLRYQRFQWICGLARSRHIDLHEAVFGHFARYPEDLNRLEWRDFEVLLDTIFQRQGFRTELGPGCGDNGIDLRIYSSDSVGEIVTLVQAKRYAPNRPIDLEAVAALSGLVDAERAHRGLFVTTSRFLPVAKQFAEVTSRRIRLADRESVVKWCGEISQNLHDFLSTGQLSMLRSPLRPELLSDPLVGEVLVARHGYNISANHFCRVVAASRYEAILQPLRSRVVSGDEQSGLEVPILTESEGSRFFALRKDSGFWGGRKWYVRWSGQPVDFNHLD